MDTLTELFSSYLFWRALAVGSIMSIIFPLLGSLVVIRKESFVGHSLASAAFLGVTISLWIGVSHQVGILIAVLLASFLLFLVQNYQGVSGDSAVAFIDQFSFAAGAIALSYFTGYWNNLGQYLFGDILSISRQDIMFTFVLMIIVLFVYLFFWRGLMRFVLNADLAKSVGSAPSKFHLLYLVSLALAVSLGVKMIGIVLISAFLVLPVNIAKFFARSFKMMLVYSIIIALIGTLSGLVISFIFDLPSGATIIFVLCVFFLLGGFYAHRIRNV